MGYSCISASEVRERINAADKTLNSCFDMLMDFRHGRDGLEKTIQDFQPTLAECLYELMQFYQELHREKDALISFKTQFDKETFSQLMKTNAQYLKVVSTTIEIGKNLGDAYVWFFFRNNRNELDKHFAHKSTGLYVGGIGGRGELEFIKNSNSIDSLYVLYHGITTMLRIGDFSLFDSEHGIIGVGELKTKQVEDKLQVTATITSKADIRLPMLPQEQKESFEDRIKAAQKDFPKLEKQLTVQSDLLQTKDAERSSDLYASYEYDILTGLTQKTPVAVNSDHSLLIVAAWSKYDSLYDVLTVDEETQPLPDDFADKAKSLMIPESPHNKIFLGPLNVQVSLMSLPIAWWNIDEKLCRDLYFQKVRIETAFNPAKLLQFFIDDGFTVTSSNSLQKFQIHKDIGNQRISVGNFESICYLVTNSLMKTKDVYAFSKQVTNALENGEYKSGSRIDMHIHLNNFGKEAENGQT